MDVLLVHQIAFKLIIPFVEKLIDVVLWTDNLAIKLCKFMLFPIIMKAITLLETYNM